MERVLYRLLLFWNFIYYRLLKRGTKNKGVFALEGAFLDKVVSKGGSVYIGRRVSLQGRVIFNGPCIVEDNVIVIVPKNKQLHISDGVIIGKGSVIYGAGAIGRNVSVGRSYRMTLKDSGAFTINGDVRIGAYCNFRSVSIGYGTRIGAGCCFYNTMVVGEKVRIERGVTTCIEGIIGDNSLIKNSVTLLGRRGVLDSNSVIHANVQFTEAVKDNVNKKVVRKK